MCLGRGISWFKSFSQKSFCELRDNSSGAILWVQFIAKTLKTFSFSVVNVVVNAHLSSCTQVYIGTGISL